MLNKPRPEYSRAVRRLDAGRWHWEVSLSAPASPVWRWETPETLFTASAQPIIRNPCKTSTQVFRIPLPGMNDAIYVKRYLVSPLKLRLKYLFRPSKAMRAFRNALTLQRLAIPTAEPIAIGEVRRFGWLSDAILMTREVADSMTWFELDQRHAFGPHRVPLLRALGRCYAELHNAGFSHSDANRNNLLVQLGHHRVPKLYLIDLDALVHRPLFTQRRAVKDLRRLLTRGYASTREKMWFLVEYCRTRRTTVTPHQLLQQVGGLAAASPTAMRIGSHWWLFRSTHYDSSLRAVLEHPDAFLLDPATFFKHSRNVTIAHLLGPAASGWVLRRLNYGKLIHRLRDFFRPSRSLRAFRNGLRLEQAGIPTARVLAAGELRRLRWPIHTYLLTEEIPGAVTLTALLERKHPQTRQALQRLAFVLAQLHNHDFSHRDLKATNILFDDQLRPHLIDLDGVRRVRFAARWRTVADLARLTRDVPFGPAVPPRLAVIFLKTYCRSRGLTDWRWWWQTIEKRLQR